MLANCSSVTLLLMQKQTTKRDGCIRPCLTAAVRSPSDLSAPRDNSSVSRKLTAKRRWLYLAMVAGCIRSTTSTRLTSRSPSWPCLRLVRHQRGRSTTTSWSTTTSSPSSGSNQLKKTSTNLDGVSCRSLVRKCRHILEELAAWRGGSLENDLWGLKPTVCTFSISLVFIYVLHGEYVDSFPVIIYNYFSAR